MRNRRVLLMLLAVVAYSLSPCGKLTSVLARSWLQGSQPDKSADLMSGVTMAHMYMTSLRQPSPADLRKADVIVAAAKAAMDPYQDYRKALADGYEIFLPNIPQPQ